MRLQIGTLLSLALAWPGAAAADARGGAPAEVADGAVPAADPADVQRALARARAQIAAIREATLGTPPPTSVPGRTVDGLPPSAMTSEAPAPAVAPSEPAPDVAWLQGLVMPDFPVRFDDRLVELLTYYRDNPRGRAHIRAWLERAGRYEPMIRRKLRAAGAPEDLMFVPMVESGFDVSARSGAAAVGMWQFVAPTAREYGMRVDRWVDQRRSPEESTDAGIAYLQDLHGRLGSWPLAMAAFNMGYGALSRAIRKYNSNDFWVLSSLEAGLPYETIVYVAKVTACAIVAKNPERFGLADLQQAPPADYVRVDVGGGAGLGRIARAAGIGVEQLQDLNPELRRKRLPPDEKLWKVRIPEAQLSRFESKWRSLRPSGGTHRGHVLRFGERLQDVAEMFGTSARKLREINGLESNDDVRAGDRVLVPDVEAQPLPEEDTPVAAVPQADFAYLDRSQIFYRVIEGDTGPSIAAHFGVATDELRKWNDITPEAVLPEGMWLQVFVPDGVELGQTIYRRPDQVKILAVGSEAFFEYHEGRNERERIRYRVAEGDTLASISKRFELSVGSIARINRFSRYSTPEPDSEIILYVPKK